MTDPDHPQSVEDALNHLSQTNVESNATMVGLAGEVKRDADARERKVELLEAAQRQTRHLLALVGIILVLMVAVGVINASNIYRTRQNAAVTRGIAEDTRSTYTLLLDCLDTTNGTCGKQNTTRTAALLDDLKRYELVAIYCARLNPRVDDPTDAGFFTCIQQHYPNGPTVDKSD